jgi:hypothetical protein
VPARHGHGYCPFLIASSRGPYAGDSEGKRFDDLPVEVGVPAIDNMKACPAE